MYIFFLVITGNSSKGKIYFTFTLNNTYIIYNYKWTFFCSIKSMKCDFVGMFCFVACVHLSLCVGS